LTDFERGIERLVFEHFDAHRHQRTLFDCGRPKLNEYLQKRLNQHMRKGIAVGYVLADPEGRIAGYVTHSAGRLPITVIPSGKGYPPDLPLPTTLIGRMAVDRRFQGRGLGAALLVHALRMAVQTTELVASTVIEVDALDDAARSFYLRYGFCELPDDARHLYLPMADARTLITEILDGK